MNKNVAVIDIDGVLADYRLGLLYWIRQSVPSLASKANWHLSRPETWIDHTTMDVPYRQWLDTLEMFRMSGGKQSIPLHEGAVELLNRLKEDGREIILLTSRPIDIYSNIYRDTVEWLRNNNLNHDAILWSKSKAEMIYKMRLTDKVIFAIDDEIKHVVEYAALGIDTYWIDLYKKMTGAENLKGCVRVGSIKEVNALLGTK